MDTTEVDLVVEVRTTEAIRTEVKDRAKEMLLAVLKRAGVTGAWRYDILMSEYKALPDPSLYRMLAELLGDTKSMLHIALRSSLMPGGAVAGILRQTGFTDFQGLFKRLLPVVGEGNRSNWKDVIVQEERISMAPRGFADIEAELKIRREQPETPPSRPLPLIDGTGRVARVRNAPGRKLASLTQLPPSRSQERPTTRTSALPAWPPPLSTTRPGESIQVGVVKTMAVPPMVSPPTLGQDTPKGEEGEISMSSFDDERRLEQFLVAAVRTTQDGIFTGKAVTPVVKEVFTERSGKGLVGGLFFRLEGLKWIRRIGQGQYQLERRFLDTHQEELKHIELKPLPALPHAKPSPRKVAVKTVAVSSEVAVSTPNSFEAWVVSLTEERRTLHAAVTSAEEALRAFDERYRSALDPLHTQLYPVPPRAD